MSKEEIEKARRTINKEKVDFQRELDIELDPILKDEDRDELRIAYLISRIEAIETLLQYIEQLEFNEYESNERLKEYTNCYNKLKEKLQKDKLTIESTYSQINGNYFMAQDRLDLINEILEILGG